MVIVVIGIDLAKSVFAVHGVDDNGKAVLVKPKVTRTAIDCSGDNSENNPSLAH